MGLKVAIFVAGAAMSAIAGCRADSSPVVTVAGGQVRGALLSKTGAVFKGIPYAQPPLADLRWREPLPVQPWSGVRDGAAFGAPCAQTPSPFMKGMGEKSSEDCLYLNVWTPEWPPRANQPVMVWIPGGGNFIGGSDEFFDAESLARRGVVVLTINYRLGVFGFFAHPALSRESRHSASGNQGLLDQIAALQWVRDNVTRFGGDPDNVTVFGESAGSIDAGVLMTSPLATGLFRRVIGESGTVVPYFADPLTLAEAEHLGATVASRWKVPDDASLKDLRSVSTAAILATELDYMGPLPGDRHVPLGWQQTLLGVAIDGYVVPKKPAEVFATGQQHRVALLLGNNAREPMPGNPPPVDLTSAIGAAYGPLAGRAQALYKGGKDALYGTPADQWATDTSFRCSAVAQLMWHAAAGNQAFEYEFARVPPGSETMESHHGLELFYVFGTFDRQTRPAVDAQISDTMQQYWTNFAKTGDPNGGQLPVWPKFNVSSRAYIQFTEAGPIGREGLRRLFCDLFIEHVNRLTPQ
jgi:para-nitrobenzyl esterase